MKELFYFIRDWFCQFRKHPLKIRGRYDFVEIPKDPGAMYLAEIGSYLVSDCDCGLNYSEEKLESKPLMASLIMDETAWHLFDLTGRVPLSYVQIQNDDGTTKPLVH